MLPRRLFLIPTVLLALLGLGRPGDLAGQESTTRLLVRVLAHDAKLIGSGVGGARVTVREVATGALLASGVQEGATGDTDAIVRRPVTRGATVFDTEGAASFLAELELDEPTLVEVVAEAPLGTEHATQRGSKTLLMVPGVHIEGEGLVVELNGFTVELLEVGQEAGRVSVRARVTMLCGCPTEPGGLWDADRIRVLARLVRGDSVVAESELTFAGETSEYAGSVAAPEPGSYELQVLALDPARANTGMVRDEVRIP